MLTFLGRQKDVIKIKANVNTKDLVGYAVRKEQADANVNLMWEVMDYRFLCYTSFFLLQNYKSLCISYQSKYKHK